ADLETAGRCVEGRSRSSDSPADDEDVEGVVRTGLLQRLECLLAEVGGQLTISHRQICAFSRTFSYGPAQVHRRRTGQVLPSADEADSQKLAGHYEIAYLTVIPISFSRARRPVPRASPRTARPNRAGRVCA